ncbi:MAG: ATP-binding protein [bacterium]|nr:ATP-binding protein [bacterium]
MLTYYSLSALINCLASLVIGIFVLNTKRKNKIGYTFALYAFLVGIWSLAYFFWQTSTSAPQAYFWLRAVVACAIYISWSYLLFVFAFLGISKNKNIFLRFSFVLFTVFFVLNLFTPLLVADVHPALEFSYWGVPGVMFHVWLFLWLVYVIYPTYLLFGQLKTANPVMRSQIKYISLGLLISFAGGITNYLLWYGIPVRPYGNILVPAFVVMTAYVIVRHRFLDIRLVAARSIAYTLLILVFGSFYTGSVFLISQFFFSGSETNGQVFVYSILAFFTAFTFQPLKNFLEKLTDNIFFKSRYNSSELLYNLSQSLNTTLGFEDVLKNVYMLLSDSIHITSVIFAVKLQGRKNVPISIPTDGEYAIYTYGNGAKKLIILQYISNMLEKYHSSIVVDDLQNELSSIDEDEDKRKVYEWMVEKEVGMILPLRIKNEVIGAIVLGGKLSGEPYTTEDVNVLETFALQAAIGIENILMFMHSRDFGERLKSEVDKATTELKQKNKNLEILRHMENIINTTLDLKEMCQKIVDTILWELGYDGALISLVDAKNNVLVPTAVSQTPNIVKAIRLLPMPMESITTSLDEKRSMSVQALDLHTKITTTSLADAFSPGLPRPVSETIQKIVGMKGMIIYPLFSKDRPLGTLSLAMHAVPHDIPDAEMNVLDAFMDEVGIALENSYLYEEAKNANDALEVSNQKLIELDKMKDEFVSVASHELRTPMTAINGYVWMLLNGKGGDLQEKQRYYLQRVAQSTSRLINLVNDMLTISRIEGGRTKIENKSFELIDLIRAVNEELQLKADEKGIKLMVESEDAVMVFADGDKIHEVLINLIGNSLKFTEKGSITTTVLDKGDFISVSVTDTGKGIAAEDMPKLFTKFGRLDNSYATVAETTGTGLGLFICKKYLEAMGGTITASSMVGKGSSFTFTLQKAKSN